MILKMNECFDMKDFLTADGHLLKNRLGEAVVLRGVNAGGWLIQESWMCPVSGEDRKWANLDTLNTLAARGFSESMVSQLMASYQDHWFTEVDLDRLQDMGINCLRVPFWYRNFMKDEGGTWISGDDLDANPGIKRLDWVIEACRKRRIYVILDCHGAPGGQMMDHCCGTLVSNTLYDSQKNRDIFVDLWCTLARRYKDEPVVAAYDIMNEPQNNGGYEGDNSFPPGSEAALSRTYSVYDQVYQAIRQVDPYHLISFEAIWEGRCLPDPKDYGWENVLYQMHIYDRDREGIDTRIDELKAYQESYGVPAYAGEFNCDPMEEYAMERFNALDISWTTWAYKGAKQDLGNPWFLFVEQLPIADVQKDDFNTLLSKWGENLNTAHFKTNTETVERWIRTYARPTVRA